MTLLLSSVCWSKDRYEYQLLLRSLQAGFGLPDRAALARLCCNLWVKSAEEKQIFDYHFEQVIPLPVSSTAVLSESNPEEASQSYTNNSSGSILLPGTKPKEQDAPTTNLKQSNVPKPRAEQRQVMLRLIRYGALGGILVLIVGSVLVVRSLINYQQTPVLIPSPTETIAPIPAETTAPIPAETTAPSPTETIAPIPYPIPRPLESLLLFISITLTIGSAMLISRIPRTKSRNRTDKSSTQPNQKGKIADKSLTQPNQKGKIADKSSTQSNQKGNITALPAQLTKRVTDEIQMAQTLRQVFSKKGFLLNTDYLPVTRRQMKQSWRYLRRLVREGPAVELDLLDY